MKVKIATYRIIVNTNLPGVYFRQDIAVDVQTGNYATDPPQHRRVSVIHCQFVLNWKLRYCKHVVSLLSC